MKQPSPVIKKSTASEEPATQEVHLRALWSTFLCFRASPRAVFVSIILSFFDVFHKAIHTTCIPFSFRFQHKLLY